MTYAIDELAIHIEQGCKKYGEDNWRLGQPLRQYLTSGIRHALKDLRGETDERHDRAAMWNFAAFIETKVMIEKGILPPELDDVKDYTTKEGFDKTVRQPALEENYRRTATEALKELT